MAEMQHRTKPEFKKKAPNPSTLVQVRRLYRYKWIPIYFTNLALLFGCMSICCFIIYRSKVFCKFQF